MKIMLNIRSLRDAVMQGHERKRFYLSFFYCMDVESSAARTHLGWNRYF
jgi:hypothetical protein